MCVWGGGGGGGEGGGRCITRVITGEGRKEMGVVRAMSANSVESIRLWRRGGEREMQEEMRRE